MAIKGEVHVKSMNWAPKISLNDGRYVIRPFECKIIGQAEGLARIKASIHTFSTTFDDEAWRIITLFVNHLDSQLKPFCGKLWVAWWIYWHQAERWRLCYDSANETFQFSCTQSWWHLLCTSISIRPILLCCQGAPKWGPPFHTPPLATHLAATYHSSSSIFEEASTVPWWHSKILAGRWWNNVSSSISPMEIWRYNCLAT